MNKTVLLSTGIIALTVIILSFMGFSRFDLYRKQMAITQCLQASTVESQSISAGESTTYTTTYTVPQEEWYDRCMKENGYKR